MAATADAAVPPDLLLTGTFWFSLLAGFAYALAALVMKRSTTGSVGIWQAAFVSNLAGACALSTLFSLEGTIPSLGALWQPAVAALLFLLGQVMSIVAFTRGDVSVATPMLGLKILMVAGLTWLILEQPLPPRVWTSATLATLAVGMLGFSRNRAALRRAGFTAGCTVVAAAAYALFDVLVQHWSPAWGVGRFPPLIGVFAAGFSLAMIPLFQTPLWAIPRHDWYYLGGASLLFGLQVLLFVGTIAAWGYAAVANVMFSSRGIWSVVLVLLLGHWLAKSERLLGRRILGYRLVGAVLLTAAIVLLLV